MKSLISLGASSSLSLSHVSASSVKQLSQFRNFHHHSTKQFISFTNHQQGIRTGYLVKGSSYTHTITPSQLSKSLRYSTSNTTQTSSTANVAANKLTPDYGLGYWLLGTSACVFGMVVLGGVTRLTRSGLSMTDWKLLGNMPPSNQQEWEAEFDRYKQFPEYKISNSRMSLDEFKQIYYMEWAHRQWGRSLGVIFGLPLIAFAFQGRIQRIPGLSTKLLGLLALGGTQGLIGWWMVKSGLDEEKFTPSMKKDPRVSPYRLAVHLTSAFAIHAGLLWCGLTALRPNQLISQSTSDAVKKAIGRAKRGGNGIAGIVALTAFSGAFVAGNDAGRAYNDWPLYAGRIVPDDLWKEKYQPSWTNFFENTALVQFNHRNLAYVVALGTFFTWRRFRKPEIWNSLTKESQLALNLSLAAVAAQIGLGITTLMTYVPVSLGALHQAGALTVWSIAIWFQHTLRFIK